MTKLSISKELQEFLELKVENENDLFYKFNFNNFIITVIKNKGSFGSENDLWEIGKHYIDDISCIGHLTSEKVINILNSYIYKNTIENCARIIHS